MPALPLEECAVYILVALTVGSYLVRYSGHTLPQETRQERTTEAQQRRERLQRSLTEGPDLVIDCDFEGMMNDGELKHLCQQVGAVRGRGGVRGEGVREEGRDGGTAALID